MSEIRNEKLNRFFIFPHIFSFQSRATKNICKPACTLCASIFERNLYYNALLVCYEDRPKTVNKFCTATKPTLKIECVRRVPAATYVC